MVEERRTNTNKLYDLISRTRDYRDLNTDHMLGPNRKVPDSPLRFRSKHTGGYIYYHKYLTNVSVKNYTELYQILESQKEAGKIDYNPFAKYHINSGDNGYYGYSLHQGDTLREYLGKEKDKDKIESILEQYVWINNYLYELGYEHGHMHPKNVCVREGKIYLIDISNLARIEKMDQWHKEMSGYNKLYSIYVFSTYLFQQEGITSEKLRFITKYAKLLKGIREQDVTSFFTELLKKIYRKSVGLEVIFKR